MFIGFIFLYDHRFYFLGMIIGLVAQYIKDDEKKLHIFNQTILDNMTTPSDVKLHLYSQENNLLKNYTCHTNSANLGSKVGL